jgi:hypothetical protein
MRITYREGESLILAQVDQLAVTGSVLTAHLCSGQSLNFPFPSAEVLEEFFREVILTCGDKPISLECTNYAPQLGELLDAWDAMYD